MAAVTGIWIALRLVILENIRIPILGSYESGWKQGSQPCSEHAKPFQTCISGRLMYSACRQIPALQLLLQAVRPGGYNVSWMHEQQAANLLQRYAHMTHCCPDLET